MSVRSRLIIAFVAISVLPLSAVTLFSYHSSRTALRRAAEQQARTMATELGHRMEWVTRDLERRMDRIWTMPGRDQRFATAGWRPMPPAGSQAAPRPPTPSEPASGSVSGELAGELAGVLGEVAPMLEALEIETGRAAGGPASDQTAGPAATATPAPDPARAPAVPVTPAVPETAVGASTSGTAGGGVGAQMRRGGSEPAGAGSVRIYVKGSPPPGVPGPHGVPPVPPTPIIAVDATGRMTVEMSQVISLAMKKYQESGGEGAPSREQLTAWAKALQEQIGVGAAELERASERQVRQVQAAARARERAAGGAERTRAAAAAGERTRAAAAAGERARAETVPVKKTTVFKGRDVSLLVQQDGHEVGRINAKLNLKRLLGTVLVNSRRDQGETAFAVDADGNLHGPEGADRQLVTWFQPTAGVTEGATSVRTVNDWVVVTRKDRSGVTFGIARPIADDLRDLRRVAARNFGLGFGLIALVFVGSIPLAGRMTRHLKTLMSGVQQISRGDLSARIPVRSHDEFGHLAGAFNQMAEDLAAHQKMLLERERMHRELELCRQIQIGILPREALRLGVAEVKGMSIPAREVGGDFFNYFVLPDGNIAVLVGDVSGKGVSAALLMANIQATLRARLPLENDLAALADALDRDLEATTPPEVFLTLFVGIVDTHQGVLRYVNAGHNTQFVLRRETGLERMSTTGMPLGLFSGHGYHERTVRLEEGDLLFFYTDGMVETENEAGEVWGVEHLEPLLLQGPNTDVDAVLARVDGEVRRFRGGAEPLDDATLMVLRFGKHL
ncbi:MAG: HAMP domain-containing protein [Acidobacteria bacterium]|nr:MAG: HAMP domain-containing protein [Acidobacteriota bacterium]